MTPFDYDFLCRFLKERSGLVLTSDKQYLIESRLGPVIRKHGIASISDLCTRLKAPGAVQVEAAVVEAMTTNESFFFRDKTPFEMFKDTMLPALLTARATQKKLRIWCAAASTGQEPYSIAMILKEMESRLAGWRFEIIGTDLSTEVLDKAKAGAYTQFEVQRGLPVQLLMKFFTQKGDVWEIAPEIRSMVQYRTLNLLRDFSSLGQFDIIFCRNVLIYFSPDVKAKIIRQFAQALNPRGFLILGASESLSSTNTEFEMLRCKPGFIYRRKN